MDNQTINAKMDAVIESNERLKTAETELAIAISQAVEGAGSVTFRPSPRWADAMADPAKAAHAVSDALNREGVSVDYHLEDLRPATGFIKEIIKEEDALLFVLEDIDSGEETRVYGEDIIDYVPVAEFLFHFLFSPLPGKK